MAVVGFFGGIERGWDGRSSTPTWFEFSNELLKKSKHKILMKKTNNIKQSNVNETIPTAYMFRKIKNQGRQKMS